MNLISKTYQFIKEMEVRHWAGVLSLLLMFVEGFFSDHTEWLWEQILVITDALFIGEIAFVVILSLVFRELKQMIAQSQKYNIAKYFRLKHQNDTYGKFVAIWGGLFMIIIWLVFAIIAGHRWSWPAIGVVAGVTSFIHGLYHKNSIILESRNNEITWVDGSFCIASNDQILKFKQNQLEVVKQNGEVQHLRKLDIRVEEMSGIVAWIKSQLKNTDLEFREVIDEKLYPIETKKR